MEILLAILTWISSVGTNTWITGFILNNIILFWIITKITPSQRDDTFLADLRKRMGIGGKDD